MRRRFARAGLLAALFSISFGCSSRPPVKKTPPPDPLLMSKTPVQARYGTTIDAQSRPVPAPPTMPVGAWVAAPSVRPANSGQPNTFRWTSDKKEMATASAHSVTLEGVLEGSADDQWVLHCTSGRKVLLEGHPQLDLFEAGYRISVQGELQDGTQPRCRVKSVLLLSRGQ